MSPSRLPVTDDHQVAVCCATCLLWRVDRASRGRQGLCMSQTLEKTVAGLNITSFADGARLLVSGEVLSALRAPVNHVTTSCSDLCPRWKALP